MAHEVDVHGAGGFASLVNGPNDEGLTSAGIAGGKHAISRRGFVQAAAVGLAASGLGASALGAPASLPADEKAIRDREGRAGRDAGAPIADALRRPNVLFVFADQWRAQATGYAGDPNVHTPNLDRLARESIHFVNAVSGCPVCSPYRASLVTGQYPLTHGVFLNDLHLRDEAVSIAEAFNEAGYQTAYIGKWHLDGHGRSSFIPRERRQGFQFWKVLECTHEYNRSAYYGDDDAKKVWGGYDAIAQTREAQRYLRGDATPKPFALFLSWGPPHDPYQTAPKKYRRRYDPASIQLRRNVPEEAAAGAREDLAGYYAHCAALDACMGDLLQTLRRQGPDDDTIVVFTSDHGDMLGSQGQRRKQRPWDESIRVPFLVRYPARFGREGKTARWLLNAPDVMPTLLTLCGISTPKTVEGRDLSAALGGAEPPEDDAALLACYSPFGEWVRRDGGKEYRGIRTQRYTYVRDREGPWLLYDNQADPYQLSNLVGRSEAAGIQERLDSILNRKLEETHDTFRPGDEYVRQWGYVVDENGTVPYTQ